MKFFFADYPQLELIKTRAAFMKRIFHQFARFFIVLSSALSGNRHYEPLSHYPGTARFVGPWRRGAWAPSHPDAWVWQDEEEDYSGSFCYCKRYRRTEKNSSEVYKPRATRE